MPIVYEYGFGGRHEDSNGQIHADPRNPVGRGFRGKRSPGELEGLPLPNIEDPRALVTQVGDNAHPAGFGFIAPHWQPRLAFAGTYDDAWERERAPYLPEDFDPKFFNAAHPGLVFDRHLVGGEPIRLENLSRRGLMEFTLPTCRLRTDVRIGGETFTPRALLETVLIEPELNRLCMTWRCATSCDKRKLRVRDATVTLEGLDA